MKQIDNTTGRTFLSPQMQNVFHLCHSITQVPLSNWRNQVKRNNVTIFVNQYFIFYINIFSNAIPSSKLLKYKWGPSLVHLVSSLGTFYRSNCVAYNVYVGELCQWIQACQGSFLEPTVFWQKGISLKTCNLIMKCFWPCEEYCFFLIIDKKGTMLGKIAPGAFPLHGQWHNRLK